VVSPVTGGTSLIGGFGAPNAVFVAFRYGYTTSGPVNNTKTRIRLYKEYNFGTPTYDVVNNTQATNANELIYGPLEMDIGRASNGSPLNPGGITLAYAFTDYSSAGSGSLAAGLRQVYPSNATPTADSTAVLSLGSTCAYVFTHQDRFFGIRASTNQPNFQVRFGPGFAPYNEVLEYTTPNEYSVNDSPTNGLILVNENPTGFGSWASVNASELFLVKQVGGGAVIRGDINYPTVVRLPGIASTKQYINKGALLPNGSYCYGAVDAFWVWGGGDACQNISPQLEPVQWGTANWLYTKPFWIPPSLRATAASSPTAIDTTLLGLKGRSAFSYPFIFTPFNWIYDIRTNAWWRYSNPNLTANGDGTYTSGASPIYMWHDVSATGEVIAAPWMHYPTVGPAQNEVFSHWDPKKSTDNFTWVSQPLARTRNRLIEVREVDLVAQGNGIITITLTGLGGVQSAPISYTINSANQPVTINSTLVGLVGGGAFQSGDVVVTIQSQAVPNTLEAPRVYRVVLGYREIMTAR
jgi:hypothetical protein